MQFRRSAILAATSLAALASEAPLALAAQTAVPSATTVAVVALPDWHPDITRDNAMSAETMNSGCARPCEQYFLSDKQAKEC